MKIAMKVEVSVAANSTNKNVLRDEQYQAAPFTGLATWLSTGSAAGLRETLNVGGQSILDAGIVNTQNRVPLTPDDIVLDGIEVYQGQPFFLPVVNTTAGALTYRATIILEEAVEA